MIAIDLARRRATVASEAVGLTPTAYRLLHHLAPNAGTVLPQTHLLTAVGGPAYRDERDDLWAYLQRRRRKREAVPERATHSRSEPGLGSVPASPPIAA